jgi:hypothetical protein
MEHGDFFFVKNIWFSEPKPLPGHILSRPILGHRGLVSSPVFVASILNLSQGTNRRDYYFLWNPLMHAKYVEEELLYSDRRREKL